MSVPGDRSAGTLPAFLDNGRARSPLIIKDLDLYPQPPTNTRSPTLNLEEPNNPLTTNGPKNPDPSTQREVALLERYRDMSR